MASGSLERRLGQVTISCVVYVSVGGKLPPNPYWGARQGVQPFLWGVGGTAHIALFLASFWSPH